MGIIRHNAGTTHLLLSFYTRFAGFCKYIFELTLSLPILLSFSGLSNQGKLHNLWRLIKNAVYYRIDKSVIVKKPSITNNFGGFL